MSSYELETFQFEENGPIPNNQKLPVLLYKNAIEEQFDQIETLFHQNNWSNSWTNGVYNYHHYHSNAHEVLGVANGEVTLQLGGDRGPVMTIKAGDMLVLPAGTGHKKISATSSFRIVGAYPNGMAYNLRTEMDYVQRLEILEEIRSVPLPNTDPVFDSDGPLLKLWSNL